MTPSEIISFAVFGVAALAMAAGGILALGGLIHVERIYGRWFAIAIVPLMAAGIAISSLLSGRDLKYYAIAIDAAFNSQSGGGAATTWLLRLLTFACVGSALAVCVGRAFKPARDTDRKGHGLLLAFLLFYVCNSVLNSFFGTVPAFTHQSLYMLVVFSAIHASSDESAKDFMSGAKLALLFLMVASLLVALLSPKVAVQPNYVGWIPGLGFRLWGVGSNPNSIGPLALLLLLMEAAIPTRSRALRWAAIGSALIVLVLAQSKTAWGAGLLTAAVLLMYRHGRAPGGGIRIGIVLSLIACAVLVALAVMLGYADRAVDRLIGSGAGVEALTLTGRTQIWSAAIDAWRANPLFGYGPSAWGPLHRANIGMPFALSAHNQFMQSLSVAGSLGAAAFVVYLGFLATHAWRAAAVTRGVSIALLVLVVVRCVTEAPFSVNTLFNGDMLTQLVLFRLALLGAPRRRSETSLNFRSAALRGHGA